MIPALVATALPPLNPAKRGYVCPKAATTPANKGWISTHSQIGNKVAAEHFSMSMIRTMMPAFFPNTRKVLVVPLFPLPYLRMSV